MTSYGYSRVPGSDQLKTAPRGGDDAVAALEALDPSATAGRWVRGEWLCRTVVRGGGVSVLEDVFDRLLPLHEAEEAAVYVQLYRLSYGEERNWCRTSRKVLRARSNLSDRRLGGALSGLVEKDHIRLLHRDRRGTLYRVRLPHEIFDEPDRDLVFSARPGPKGEASGGSGTDRTRPRSSTATPTSVRPKEAEMPATSSSKASRARSKTGTGKPAANDQQATKRLSPSSGGGQGYNNDTLITSPPKRGRRLTVGEVASGFLQHFPGRASSNAEVVEAVFLRMEENIELSAIASELKQFGEAAPAHLKVTDLGRWLQST